jgi:PAS domain S-box-containing protein
MKKFKNGSADTGKATTKTNVFQRSSLSMWEVDITELRAMLSALRLRGIQDLGRHLDEHPELVEKALRSIRVIDVNDATLELFETADKDALLGPLPFALDAAALAAFKGLIVAVNEGKAVFETEVAARTFAGRRLDVIFRAHVPHGIDGDLLMLANVFDITERKRLGEKLEGERALLQTVIDYIPDHIYLKDRESRFLLANRSLALWIGASRPEDLIGRTDHEFFPRELADAFRADEVRIFETGQSQISKEERSRSASGEMRWVLSTKMPLTDDTGAVTRIVGIGRDITERKDLQTQIMRAQRLESLATLATGIAHQFNNINAVVKGYIDVALLSGGLPTTIAVYLGEALKGVQRMVDITERLQGLVPSSRSVTERSRIEVVARSILPLFEKRFEEQGVTLRLELLDTAPLRIDSSQIGFIVTSLITNALNAVMDRPIRAITVRSGAASGSVFLEVGDTGCGIPPECVPRLFDPFFTTKGEWAPESSTQRRVKGVGLSLTVCQSTVAECGGKIEVQSELGEGSLFRVVLPVEGPATRTTLPTP